MGTFENVSFWNKNITFLKESIFGQNGKCIALLFHQKWAHLTMYHFQINITFLKQSIFGQNGKCIALLFHQKWAHLKMYYFGIKTSHF